MIELHQLTLVIKKNKTSEKTFSKTFEYSDSLCNYDKSTTDAIANILTNDGVSNLDMAK